MSLCIHCCYSWPWEDRYGALGTAKRIKNKRGLGRRTIRRAGGEKLIVNRNKLLSPVRPDAQQTYTKRQKDHTADTIQQTAGGALHQEWIAEARKGDGSRASEISCKGRSEKREKRGVRCKGRAEKRVKRGVRCKEEQRRVKCKKRGNFFLQHARNMLKGTYNIPKHATA
jgi:hypothetical protein